MKVRIFRSLDSANEGMVRYILVLLKAMLWCHEICSALFFVEGTNLFGLTC